VRWVDGIVSGTAAELAEFLATVTPVLDRSHGTATLGGSLAPAANTAHAAAA
jgi:hypothetical protein